MNVTPGATYEAVADGFATGLTGTIGVRLIDNQGATTNARVTAGIAEYPAGSGIYTVTLTAPAVAGQYTIVWDNGATTPGNIATDDLIVTGSAPITVTGALYITRDEMKTALAIGGTNTYADTDIDRACTAVSRALDYAARGDSCHFFQATETRYYEPNDFNFYVTRKPYGPEYRLQIDDITSATTVTLDTTGDGSYATTLTQGTDFYLDPPNAATDLRPYEELVLRTLAGRIIPPVQRPVRITGTFGWPTVPIEVSQYAVFFVSQTVLRTRQAPFGILMQGMEVGATARLMRTDPDFDRFLGGLTKRTLML